MESSPDPKIYLATSNVNGVGIKSDIYMVTFHLVIADEYPDDSVRQTEIMLIRASSQDEALKTFIEDDLLRAVGILKKIIYYNRELYGYEIDDDHALPPARDSISVAMIKRLAGMHKRFIQIQLKEENDKSAAKILASSPIKGEDYPKPVNVEAIPEYIKLMKSLEDNKVPIFNLFKKNLGYFENYFMIYQVKIP